jgi:hypothetical protein
MKKFHLLFTLPLFVVPKDDGQGLRLIVDMRALNIFLRKRNLKLPTLARNRAEFNDILGFWTYDLTSAYQHVEIAKEDQKYFGIQWKGETFLICVCPYGCSTIPEMFQTVAGTPLAFLNEFGFCPDLLTAQDWHDVATNKRKLPPLSRRYRILTLHYLDDYGSLLKHSIRSLDGKHTVTGEPLKRLAHKLSQSFKALFQACGFKISLKSQQNPFTTNIFLGMIILITSFGTFFRIPEKKRIKSLIFYKKILKMKTVSLREAASLAGKILRWKLVWNQYASLYAAPIYHELAAKIRLVLSQNKEPNWNIRYQMSNFAKEMLLRVISLLEPGEHQLLQAPVLIQRERIEHLWEVGAWNAHLQSSGKEYIKVLSDASDISTCTWVSTMDINETLQADEYTILTESDNFTKWANMREEEFSHGSVHREALAFCEFYEDKTCMRKMLDLLHQRNISLSQGVGMIHLTDAKSLATILRKGTSKHPHLHRLVLRIYDATRVLRHRHGWSVGWIRRNLNKAADAGTKLLHDWQINKKIFEKLHSEFNFTLDGFASESERPNKTIPYCSRYVCNSSSGDARVVNWNGHTVWCFPPANILMISLSLRKFMSCSSNTTMVLCVPSRHSADWWSLVWNAPSIEFRTLPAGSLFRVTGISVDNNSLSSRTSSFRCSLFVFKK